MTTISSILQECHQQGVLLSLNERDGLYFKTKTGKIRKSLKDRLIENKAEIVQHFQTSYLLLDQSIAADKPDIGSIAKGKSFTSLRQNKINLNDLSSEEIIHYRLSLEESYQNPENDDLHGDDTPRHFRNGTHTFEMMEAALETFIHQKKSEQNLPLNFTKHEIDIIESYPLFLHPLLMTLVQVSKVNSRESSRYTAEELTHFRHNMQWLFVPFVKNDEWCPARLKTLWSDGWREQDILSFMTSKPVKYIMCHNDKIIQCLDLNNGVYVFEKNKRNLSERNPVEEVV